MSKSVDSFKQEVTPQALVKIYEETINNSPVNAVSELIDNALDKDVNARRILFTNVINKNGENILVCCDDGCGYNMKKIRNAFHVGREVDGNDLSEHGIGGKAAFWWLGKLKRIFTKSKGVWYEVSFEYPFEIRVMPSIKINEITLDDIPEECIDFTKEYNTIHYIETKKDGRSFKEKKLQWELGYNYEYFLEKGVEIDFLFKNNNFSIKSKKAKIIEDYKLVHHHNEEGLEFKATHFNLMDDEEIVNKTGSKYNNDDIFKYGTQCVIFKKNNKISFSMSLCKLLNKGQQYHEQHQKFLMVIDIKEGLTTNYNKIGFNNDENYKKVINIVSDITKGKKEWSSVEEKKNVLGQSENEKRDNFKNQLANLYSDDYKIFKEFTIGGYRVDICAENENQVRLYECKDCKINPQAIAQLSIMAHRKAEDNPTKKIIAFIVNGEEGFSNQAKNEIITQSEQYTKIYTNLEYRSINWIFEEIKY